jgi:hypothetical protein
MRFRAKGCLLRGMPTSWASKGDCFAYEGLRKAKAMAKANGQGLGHLSGLESHTHTHTHPLG